MKYTNLHDEIMYNKQKITKADIAFGLMFFGILLAVFY